MSEGQKCEAENEEELTHAPETSHHQLNEYSSHLKGTQELEEKEERYKSQPGEYHEVRLWGKDVHSLKNDDSKVKYVPDVCEMIDD